MNCLHCNTPLPDDSRFCNACGADVSDPGSGPRMSGTGPNLRALLAQVLVDRYEVGEMLGRGGMGAVFLATDLTLDRPVAIKVLPPELSHDENFVRRFEREARTAAKLDHPNIVPIFAVESGRELNYFVMKYVTGQSLEDLLEEGPVPLETCQRILWEAAQALGHAHARGVVHRDLKPANLMLDNDGRTMLTDFGISKAIQSVTQFTGTGQIIGTPLYMSPEQAKGLDVDGRSDQYSLCVVGYQMLAGRLPFADDSLHTVMYKHIFEMPPPLTSLRPETPADVAAAIHRGLSKEPDERFPAMEEFANAVWPEHPLESRRSSAASPPPRASSDAPTQIAAPPTTLRKRPAPRRKRRGWAVAALVVALLGGGGAYWAQSSGFWSFAAGPELAPDTLAEGAGVAPLDTPESADPSDTVTLAAAETAAAIPVQQPPPAQAQTPPPVRETRPPPVVRRQPPVRPPPPADGFLSVNSDPWGTVQLDGVDIGDTPVVRRALRPGQHVVRIVREGCRTVEETVTITAGNHELMRKILVCGQA